MSEIRVESNSRTVGLKGVHLDGIEDLGPILLSSNNFANLLEWEKATSLIALERIESQHRLNRDSTEVYPVGVGPSGSWQGGQIVSTP
jgi:hypothetical protein